ncbi:MAG: O-methyltransferase [Lachnospiraceae bacterium]|nr:O-methyltransferase [Lachnospiraceae bacterium]
MRTFLMSMEPERDPLLWKIREEAERDRVPIIRPETEALLRTFLKMKDPDRILEIGTAVGYSALYMLRHSAAEITTIENYGKRVRAARENFGRTPEGRRVRLVFGDAGEELPKLEGSYPFIFMDAAKGQYLHFLPEIMRLLAPGGILISDNVLQEGMILESHYLVSRRNRTIYKRMREYLWEITHNDALTTMLLPIGDGLAVSVRNHEAAGEPSCCGGRRWNETSGAVDSGGKP